MYIYALQSVIYNAKKRLEKAGLPDVNYMRSETVSSTGMTRLKYRKMQPNLTRYTTE